LPAEFVQANNPDCRGDENAEHYPDDGEPDRPDEVESQEVETADGCAGASESFGNSTSTGSYPDFGLSIG
jgi:hypothetical protein